MELISQLALILSVGVLSGIAALKLKTPLIVGYIFGGTILSLLFHNQFDPHSITELAEVGVALLLFSIGIEFSLDKLMKVRKFALVGGTVQIIATTIMGIFVFPAFGFSSYEAFFLGSVLSLSSTAVVVKVLDAIGQIETHASQIMIGWLILQDIAVVLIIILLDNFSKGGVNFVSLTESIFKSFILIALSLFIGRRVIPQILKSVSKLRSRELMVIIAFAFCLIFAFISEQLEVSFTLGAFLAGLMISESFLNHEIFNEVRPLQSLFSLFFFITIGTLFSFDYLFGHIFLVLGVLIVAFILKAIIILAINLGLKMHIRNAVEVTLGLSQFGEFAFLSASIGLDRGWISQDLNNLVISVTIISLLIAPLLITQSDRIFDLIRDIVKGRFPEQYAKFFLKPEQDLAKDFEFKDHIILCGFGRVGKFIALAFKNIKLDFVVIDIDTEFVEDARKKNMNVIYGDATSEEILTQAGIERARAIIVALPKETEVIGITKKARELNDKIKVVVRRHHKNLDYEQDEATTMIEPEFEASIKILEAVLPLMGRGNKRVVEWLRQEKDLLI